MKKSVKQTVIYVIIAIFILMAFLPFIAADYAQQEQIRRATEEQIQINQPEIDVSPSDVSDEASDIEADENAEQNASEEESEATSSEDSSESNTAEDQDIEQN